MSLIKIVIKKIFKKSKVQPYDEIRNAFLKCILYVKILLLIFKDVGLDILSNT